MDGKPNLYYKYEKLSDKKWRVSVHSTKGKYNGPLKPFIVDLEHGKDCVCHEIFSRDIR